jgi:PAS domain S-box-containing protein
MDRGTEPTLDQIDGVVVHIEAGSLRPLYASGALRLLVDEEPAAWLERPQSWQGLFDAEDWPRVARLCQAVARDGRRRRVEHLLRINGRDPHWFRTSIRRLSDGNEPVLVAHMLDLSEGTNDDIAAQQAWTREILRQAPLAVFVLDGRGVVRLAEGRGLDRLGVEPRRILGRSMLVGRWPRPWIVENARRVLRGEPFSDIASIDTGWLSIKYVPVRDRRGRVRGALGFATDITDCKRVVDLIDTIDAVLWQTQGARLHLGFVGGAAERLFGDDVAEWLEHPDFLERHLVDAERETVMAVLDSVSKDGVERTIVHRIQRRNGIERWCRTTLRAIAPDENGHRAVAGLTLDITERKAAEEALASRDRRWQLLAAQAPVIVYTVDRDLRFTSGMGAGLAALGLRPDRALLGISLEQYFQAQEAARPLIEAHRRALEGETVRTESSWLGRAHQVVIEPLRDPAGNIIGAVGVAVDVTERLESERERERLLRSERAAHAAADEAVRVRDRFLSVAAHELRTPLGALLLGLQAALRRVPGSDVLHNLQLAERQAQRLNTLIAQLLDASRLAAGRQLDIDRQRIDLAAVAREIVERFEPELTKTGTVLSLDAPRPVRGSWDRSRMDQMITNLLSNAIKYGRNRPVEMVVEPADPAGARIIVRDQGIGIPSAEIPLIFRPFERLHEGQYTGLGLGLYIVAEIVKGHGGEIRVDSEPGRGTSFTVELPDDGA